MICPVAVISGAQITWAMPLAKVSGKYIEKVKKVDFGGCILSLAAIILILVGLYLVKRIE